MKVYSNVSLKPYNTFGIDVLAKKLVIIDSIDALKTALDTYKDEPKLILGGGSNLLLTQNIEAVVLQINLKGISIIRETEEHVWVAAQAGENWHDFVLWCIENEYGGIENMSLIPGNVGTTPVQNIGAYGVEVQDVLESCTAISIDNQEFETFSNAACQFGYRESIFKNEAKNKYIITSVVFKLTKKNHTLHVAYGDIALELQKLAINTPTIKEVSQAIINIRKSKLPNPKDLGNSGSFFKNPIISKARFSQIQAKFPNIKYFDISATEVKVPAGWLIEQAGFKGKRIGDAGVHQNQALVLVNYGGASGKDILELSQKIQATILETFGIFIEAEVNIL